MAALSNQDTLQSDISYLGISSQLSEYAKSKLLQIAPRCRLAAGEELSPPSDENVSFPSLVSPLDGQMNAFIIVLHGQIDVFWDGDEDAFMEFSASNSSSNSNASSTLPEPSEEVPPAAVAQAERTRLEELAQLRKTPLASIRRGQTFGDQMIGLALDKLYPGAQLTSTSVPVRLASRDAATEVIWISKELYEEHLREDRVSLSYHPLSSVASASSRFAGEFRDWAPLFFSKRGVFNRDPSDLGELSRRMLADAKMAKLLFQFPPLVLERICHAMELRHFTSNGLFLGIGDQIAHISIVAQGALRTFAPPPTAASSTGNESLLSRTSSTISTVGSAVGPAVKQQQDVIEQYVPGDIFGAAKLSERSAAATSSSIVYAEADTLLLSIPKIVFERWLAPLYVDTIFNPGSCFQSLMALGQSSGSGRSLHCDKRGSKPATSPTRRQSVVLLSASETELVDTNFAALEQEPSPHTNALEHATHLLRKMGILPLIPRFVLSEMLLHMSVVYKQAGDMLFHEGEESQCLVVVLTGFLSFYSIEHMSTTIEMFQKHSFCHFSSFQGSQTNPEDFVADGIANEDMSPSRSATIAKHRAAMHGVHIQTLHAGNAFRTGVLLEGTICPATVVAQTNCEYLVIEESVYLQLIKAHTPVVDLSKFELHTTVGSMATALPEQEKDDDSDDIAPFSPNSLRSILVQRNPTTLHPAVVKCFEKAHVPWLTRSPLKMQKLLRGMRCVSVNPGERLIRCNDVLDHLIIVLSGKLSLYIRQNEDVSTFLDASQRSVRSLMLERSVTSNYSTTSQQLYKEANNGGGGSTSAGACGQTGSRKDAFAKRKVIRSKISRISESELSVDSVLAAVHEERLRGKAAAEGLSTSTTDTADYQNLLDASTPRKAELSSSSSPPLSRSHNRPTPNLLIHSAAAKSKLQQKIDTRRSTMLSQDGSSTTGSLFLCNLGPGEVFGDEILAPHGIFRSVHDVFVDNNAPSPASPSLASSSELTDSAGKSASSPATNNPCGAQLLLLNRQLFHSVNSKTDAEIEKELYVRSKLAKSKWHSAERKITRRLSQASVNRDHNSGGGGKATSKLFDLFKNILNQRCFLTMRAIADIPLLRDLPDASKHEICLAARFEALECGMNAYKENGAHSSAPRYYILISGRLGLYAKNLNGTFYSHSGSNNGGGGSGNRSSSLATGGTTTTAPTGAENCLREVLVGDGFGEFEILVPELSNRCISALALESCRLLSFPANAFLNQWPHIASMKSDIEYLRTRVPFFSRLELEKIAYLYTTLSFQTFTRGSNIFEQNHAVSNHFSNLGELYLLKEGSCSIRQRVVLDSQQSDGKVFVSSATKTPEASRSGSGSINRHHVTQQNLPTHRLHHPEKHLFRVMVTVADVCDGHLFWINGGGGNDATFPFTLQAMSASVTITNIATDKLRAILPRTQLAALERASNQMMALYSQQYAMAQHAVVALMNEKRAVQMGMTSNPTFLPILNFQSPQKVILSPATANNSSTTSVSCDTSIPYSRLLMSKPVDLVALQNQERNAIQRPNPEDQLIVADGNTSISQGYAAREWRGAVDVAYRDQHFSEHYQLENGLPNSTLVGSFPDDFSLRRRRRSIEQRALEANNSPRALAQRTTRLYSPQEPQSNVLPSHLKQDECMEPESAVPIVNSTTQAGGTTLTKLNDSASHIHLEVKVPIFHDTTRTLNPRMPTRPNSARSKCRSGVLTATSSSSNMTPQSPHFPSGFQEVRGGSGGNTSSDDTGFYDLEIDLRALLRAEMMGAEAPMRTIKLEPSLLKANALGQYLAFYVPSPPPSPATRPALQHLPANPSFPKPKFSAPMPFQIFSRTKSTVKHTPVVPFSDGGSTTLRVSNQATLLHSEQASVRKQGFLCVVTVLHPNTPLVSVLPRAMQQHRRRFFSLVGNVLVEFPENLAINGEPLDTTQSLNKYPLNERSGVNDILITAITAGEAYAAALRISFVLAVDANTRLILTAESVMEKKKWMNELHQACALGPRVPMHQKILHEQQDVQLYNSNSSSSAPKTPRTSSQSFRGQGRVTSHHNAADAGADLVLQVEYRIG